MKLYICWGTDGSDHHDCAKVYRALTEARHEFELIKAKGSQFLPSFLQFKVRKEVFALTGSYFVPVLVLDNGTAMNKPNEIVAWAKKHPAKKTKKSTI